MRLHPAKYLLLLLLTSCWLSLQGQAIPEPLRDATKKIVDAAPTEYHEIHEIMAPFSGDTVQMSYFIRQCELHAYRDGLAYAYMQRGKSFREASRTDLAYASQSKALNQAVLSGNGLLQIMIQNELGAMALSAESIRTALDHFQNAQTLAESVPEPDMATQAQINLAINGIGNIYRLLDQYELAISYFERSLEFDIQTGNLNGQAVNYQNIAECHEARGRLEQAMFNYEKSLEINRELGSDKIEVVTKYGMAHVMAHNDQAAEAVDLLSAMLPKARKIGDPEILSSVHIQLGWAQSLNGQTEAAKRNLNAGLNISSDIRLFSNIYQANTFLHDIYRAQGDYKRALEYFEEAQSARRMISNDRNRRYVSESISQSQEERKQNRIELLSKENEIVKMQLRRNRTTLLVGALLLTLFILILYILYRQYQLNSEKKVLTLEQSMLRSQMNPHFLFNSLNSIKLYIINNEQKNAVHYLNKFSKLVRKILEASAMREIPLSEELETVELYLNIENIRFNNEIEFSIDVAEGIDTDLVRIPSLILQPFLENALWHGLSSKEGSKLLEIKVYRTVPGYIDISIKDNGIGRAAAHALKERRVLKRKSLGLEITKERMANFSKDYQNTYNLQMEDLFDHEGNPAGTIVRLQIPTV